MFSLHVGSNLKSLLDSGLTNERDLYSKTNFEFFCF